MKKLKLILIAIVISLVAAIGVGCASAYDVAVKNGYSGTEQQWLESLKGKDGADGKDITIDQVYLKAQENGFDGSYLDFLNEYLSVELSQSNEAAISTGLRSAVEVYAAFGKQTLTGQSRVLQGGAGVIYQLNKQIGTAYIITNYHVVCSEKNNVVSNEIYVIPYGGVQIAAKYIGGTPAYDIAVLKAESVALKDEFFKTVSVNTSDVLVGQTAIAIGNPSGSGISATEGIVSVDSEYITMNSIDNPLTDVTMRVMRIDAAVNSGNSGGGLFNSNGEFIGVVNAKSGDSNIENVGYAIPASIAVSVAKNIIRNGAFIRGFAGITVYAQDAHAYLDADGRARLVEKVTVENVSGAATGILQRGDIIVSVEVLGVITKANRKFNVIDALLAASPGNKVTFTILRDGKQLDMTIILNN